MMTSSPEITTPDGGWGWVVVFTCFFMHLAYSGLIAGMAAIYVDLQVYLDQNASNTAWVVSAFNGICCLSALLPGFLIKRFSERSVTIVGSFVFALGVSLGALSNHLVIFIASFSFVGGVGASLCYTPGYVMIAKYFDKRRGFAISLATGGSGIGWIVVPLYANAMMKEFGLRGTFLMLGGLVLQLIPLHLLYRNPNETKRDRKVTDSPNFSSYQRTNSKADSSEKTTTLSKLELYRKESNGLDINGPEQNEHFREAIALIGPKGCVKTNNAKVDEIETHTRAAQLSNITRLSLNSFEKAKHVHLVANSTIIGRQNKTTVVAPCGSMAASIADVSKEEMAAIDESNSQSLFDFSLLKDTTFVMLTLSSSLVCLGSQVTFTVFPALGLEIGFTQSQSTLLVSCIGFTDLFSRFTSGFILDLPRIKPFRLVVWGIAMATCGVIMMVVAVVKSYYVLALSAAVFGISYAIVNSQTAVVISDVIGVNRLGQAFSFLTWAQGFSVLASAPLAGALKDFSGSYTWCFVFGAVVCWLAAACLFVSRLLSQLVRNKCVKK